MLAIVKWADNMFNVICRDKADDCLKIKSAQYKQKTEALMTKTCCSKLKYWSFDFSCSSETLKIKNRIQLETASSRRADDS